MDERNPYCDRAAINDINRFYGRRSEVSYIYSRISAPNPQSISIVGDRHMGKSSLLNFICSEENRKKYLNDPHIYTFVSVNLQTTPMKTIPDFIRSLLRLTFEASEGSMAFKVADLLSVAVRTEYDRLKRLAMELQQEGRRLIVLLDNFDLVTQNETFDPRFYAFLRAMASNYDISFIISSTHGLHELSSGKAIANSPFFNIFSKIQLGPFKEEEAIDLIEGPSSAAGFPLSRYTQAIISMSGMMPIFIQMACSAFFEHIKVDGRVKDENGIRVIEEIFFEEAKGYFECIWDGFSKDIKDMCKAILAGDEIDEDRKNMLIDLIRRGYVLEKGSRYELFSSTFANRIVAHS